MDKIRFEYKKKIGISGKKFYVEVTAGLFSGSAVFDADDEYLQEIVSSLKRMYDTLSGTCNIVDSGSDYVIIESLKHGHFGVHGLIGGSYNPTHLAFELKIDQTDLKVIISQLKTILESA